MSINIFVIGKNGMLGNYVYSYLKNNTKYNVIGLDRTNLNIITATQRIIKNMLFHLGMVENDVIINCAGVIPQRNNNNILDSITVNSVFPYYLYNVCKQMNSKLIHISTDCVFSGEQGHYTEKSIHDAKDVYGKTKSLGEPKDATIIRTSIIGEELNNFNSLLEWVKSNKDKEVLGYINHFWNGVTCLQFAKICEYMIDNNIFWGGVKHIISPEIISKYNLIKLISKIYNLNIKVNGHMTNNKCDRTLSTIKNIFKKNIPNLETQLIQQKEFLEGR